MTATEEFALQVATGVWPADNCLKCRNRGIDRIGGSACCRSYGHHVGDFCLHCGNNERGSGWRYRE